MHLLIARDWMHVAIASDRVVTFDAVLNGERIMILGMSSATFVLVHVVISLIGSSQAWS